MTKTHLIFDLDGTVIDSSHRQRHVDGVLDLALCTAIAERPEFQEAEITARGVVAKARTMGMVYRKVERLTKAGDPVIRKDELVAKIEASLGLSGLDSLAKAEKPALKALLDAVSPRSVEA